MLSDLIWDNFDLGMRGEAIELFSDALLSVMTSKEQDNCAGNEATVDALEWALNILCKDPKRLKRLKRWIETCDEPEEEYCDVDPLEDYLNQFPGEPAKYPLKGD